MSPTISRRQPATSTRSKRVGTMGTAGAGNRGATDHLRQKVKIISRENERLTEELAEAFARRKHLLGQLQRESDASDDWFATRWGGGCESKLSPVSALPDEGGPGGECAPLHPCSPIQLRDAPGDIVAGLQAATPTMTAMTDLGDACTLPLKMLTCGAHRKHGLRD